LKDRLDVLLAKKGIATSRSQAESWIKLGKVFVEGQVAKKSGVFVNVNAKLELKADEKYVSRAGLKLSSVAVSLGLNFAGKIILDVGSSTGGFTDYALQHGAKKVVAVDVGTNQLHPKLRKDSRIDLYEQTDIRDVLLQSDDSLSDGHVKIPTPDIVVIDVSFISLTDVLPHIGALCGPNTQIVAMCKPQFEAGSKDKHNGVIKNDTVRREILHDFEAWTKKLFVIKAKADSQVEGSKGNRERFYLLARVMAGK
jgi:23S rRNA (cytidine1920-2'-O)/16S rRNA (cytidine1409-2'-O)-methyltransferase